MAHFKTSIAEFFKGLRSALMRTGVNVGGTAAYPRVEIHSLTENPPEDKEGKVRSIVCTVECISERGLGEVVELVKGNMSRIFAAAGLSLSGFEVFGIIPGQVRMLTEQETTEQNQVIYRILQDVTVWIEETAEASPAQTQTN